MASTDRSYFDEIYADNPDPWGFETRWYEQRKYALTLAALPEPFYRRGFEPGCSVGVLTALLAPRCAHLVATEIVPSALARAVDRLSGADNVVFHHAALPESWPTGSFDLVVLSEIAYYFDATTLTEIAGRLMGTVVAGASVVAVHWRGETNYPLSGDDAHRILGDRRDLEPLAHHVEHDFVLDVWRKRP
jgi:protein-L-isoaspartate O-methyltransferase